MAIFVNFTSEMESLFFHLMKQGRRQVLEIFFFFLGGGGLLGVSLRGVSLFVSRMLLPSFVFFLPKTSGARSPPPLPTPM